MIQAPQRVLDYHPVKVICNVDGSSWWISPYCASFAEAIQLLRLTWKNDILFTLVPGRKTQAASAVTAACSKCRHELTVAYGTNAQAMTRQAMFKILLRAGWKVAPKLICKNCL